MNDTKELEWLLDDTLWIISFFVRVILEKVFYHDKVENKSEHHQICIEIKAILVKQDQMRRSCFQ